MKRLLVVCFLAVLAAPAFAVIGTIDDVPAATLLLPYFEVDLDNPNGMTTLMSINNASATAVLAHVIIWSDLSFHASDFDIYLTGYDVQTINLRDIIAFGHFPRTASAGQDPGDVISPKGPASQDINFASCTGFLPLGDASADYVLQLQESLTGQQNHWFGGCLGADHGDNIARGYVTVDTVNACGTSFQGDPNYFGPGARATDQNVLWGDYFYVNADQDFAQGETLVHIEADPNLELDPTNYTFYWRYSDFNNVPAADHREGLGNVFAVRYVNGGAFTGGSSLLSWRDSKYVFPDSFTCSHGAPAPYPLGQNQVVVFDEEENFETPQGCTISPCPPEEGLIPFPWEAQRTDVGGPALPTTPDFGWIFLNLNSDTGSGWPIVNPEIMQNWVTVTMDADGRFSVGFDAIQLGNVTNPAAAPNPYIN